MLLPDQRIVGKLIKVASFCRRWCKIFAKNLSLFVIFMGKNRLF
jgi:hypothetical protein